MSDSEYLIDGQVIPYWGGRKDTDTAAWRDATDLELKQQAEIDSLTAELEQVKADYPLYRGKDAQGWWSDYKTACGLYDDLKADYAELVRACISDRALTHDDSCGFNEYQWCDCATGKASEKRIQAALANLQGSKE